VLGSDPLQTTRAIRDHDAGEVADPEGVQSIVVGIIRLLHDPDRYALLQESTRRAAAILNWEIEKEKLLSLYERLG